MDTSASNCSPPPIDSIHLQEKVEKISSLLSASVFLICIEFIGILFGYSLLSILQIIFSTFCHTAAVFNLVFITNVYHQCTVYQWTLFITSLPAVSEVLLITISRREKLMKVLVTTVFEKFIQSCFVQKVYYTTYSIVKTKKIKDN